MKVGHALVLSVAVAPVVEGAGGSNPLTKVIEMMGKMQAEGTKAKEEEERIFNAYTKFVEDREFELEYELKRGAEKGEKLTATIAKANTDITLYETKKSDLEAEISEIEAERKAANDIRASENAEYEKHAADFGESIVAINTAIKTLSEVNADTPQAMMMLQQKAKEQPSMKRALAALAIDQSLADDDEGVVAPTAAGYESQSGGVLNMLKDLLDKFREKSEVLDKEEMNRQANHDMIVTDLSGQLDNLNRAHDQASTAHASTLELLANSKEDLSQTQALHQTAESTLRETLATFEAKKAAYEENQKVREEELLAISKAVEILQGPEATNGYADHVKVLLQKPSTSFLQTRASVSRDNSKNQVQQLLRTRAKALQSSTLSELAVQVKESPFAKVISMVEELLQKLEKQAAEEAEHKAYCDKETKENKLKRDRLTAEQRELRAQADQLERTIANQKEEISTLAEEQVVLRKEVKLATEQRSSEKAANLKAIKDSGLGRDAVRNAIGVLKQFYDNQGVAFSQRDVPQMKAYNGMSAKSGGILGMLEVVESDFARVVAETTADEEQSAKEYKAFMAESEADLKAKNDAQHDTELKMDQADFERSQTEKNFDAAGSELGAANKYYDALKPQCIKVKVSYEERCEKRKEEIASLQQAYKLLNN